MNTRRKTSERMNRFCENTTWTLVQSKLTNMRNKEHLQVNPGMFHYSVGAISLPKSLTKRTWLEMLFVVLKPVLGSSF